MRMIAVPVKAIRNPPEGAVLSAFPEIDKLVRDIENRAFELFTSRGLGNGHELDDWLAAERQFACVPPAQVSETDGEYNLDVAVPGIPAENLQVDVTPRCIIVEGEQVKKETKKEQILLSEFSDRKLFRKFELPAAIDVANVAANLDNGVLHITARKAEEKEPRRVDVAVA